jgi:hypothetical protein
MTPEDFIRGYMDKFDEARARGDDAAALEIADEIRRSDLEITATAEAFSRDPQLSPQARRGYRDEVEIAAQRDVRRHLSGKAKLFEAESPTLVDDILRDAPRSANIEDRRADRSGEVDAIRELDDARRRTMDSAFPGRTSSRLVSDLIGHIEVGRREIVAEWQRRAAEADAIKIIEKENQRTFDLGRNSRWPTGGGVKLPGGGIE